MIRLLRLSPLLLLLAAAPGDYKLGAPPLRLLPSTTAAGEQLVTPGAIVATSVLGRPDAAIMADGVTLAQAGEQRSFPRGTVLSAANVRGLPGEHERVFCEDRQEGSTAKLMTGQMLFGLVGALRPTKQDTQYCLIDADKDSFFDHAFLIGAKGKARLPYAIPKAEYGLIEGMPLGGEATVRLRYVGSGGEKDAVAFDLEAIGFGRMRALAGARHVVSIAKLPAHEIIAGAVLTVLAYDAKSGAATIVINRDLAPGHIVLPEMVE
ncbi:hypothetical protein [Sphingomonas sp. PB4P5]|uniref:hypothetical protein n=1 Tax=Parasphingomonas puruogangriensis TaxID=3096155 RepID=UPI002FC972EC